MSRAFVFPGQGSQFVGMGKDLAEAFPVAKQVFEQVDDALNEKLSTLIFEGPEEDLNLTHNTQPALMAVSMAVASVLSHEAGIDLNKHCSVMAGHSLGEYSALTASGALELADTARLLRTRGQAMQKAVPVGEGAMIAVLGLEMNDVEAIANEASDEAQTRTCELANDNSPGQVVLSGHAGAIAIARDLASEKGAKRVVDLPVSAPFHCVLMAPAAQTMATALADTIIRPPFVPVISNVTAQPVQEPQEIRRLLVDQITGTVRWRESVEWMAANGVTEVVELGAGKVLNGLVRRIHKEMVCKAAGTVEQVETLIKELQDA